MEKTVEVQLSPPWVTYYNELLNTIGKDPDATVGPLIPSDGNYIVPVMVMGDGKAEALATLLKPTVEFGGVTLTVVVINEEQQIVSPLPCPLGVFAVADLADTALSGNPYYDQTVVKRLSPGGPNAVYPVFAPEVIQFFNDDISNLCNNFTGVASKVFAEVMIEELCRVSILFSTSCEE
ncbi:hypothetical protein [Falsibacillus albus]|uniref:Uncharacterized protein n=1 Tax=Falsibacillus albus TaxID=2478915 RepID=A0A3L7JPV7_9BACI|nr:hypothetical protein [Falsibacillus albus]RLQ92285.1 hypothetical protein D9X91_19605 [Falsibacillus albus]